MPAELREEPFDPVTELRRYQDAALGHRGKYGATVTFVGTMRDFSSGAAVRCMTLEHYPAMTEKHLDRIAQEARNNWDIIDTLIIHRVGQLNPGDPIVLCAVWSAHRAAAFDACRYLIEELKTRAPFWKKETVEEGERWVQGNTPAA